MFLFLKSFFLFFFFNIKFIWMRKIIFTLFFKFLNKTMFKDKTNITTSSSMSLTKPKRKMELATVFRGKDVLCCLNVHKCVTTSKYLFCQTMIKVRCTCKPNAYLMKIYQKHKTWRAIMSNSSIAISLSLSIPKNTPILKGLNRMQATEKAGLIKLFEVVY